MTTTNQDRVIPNPTGKGGFGDNPGNRSNGGWKKENSIGYQMRRFINMSVAQFKEYEKVTSEDNRTVAEAISYARVAAARNSLKDEQEVANRTEGMPKNSTDITSGGDKVLFTLSSDDRK